MHSLGDYERFKFPYVKLHRYEVWTNNQLGGIGGRGGFNKAGEYTYLLSNDGTAQYLSISRIIDKAKGETSPSGASNCVFSSDSKEECENFISWLNTKFTRFFVAINISKLTGILTNDYFRFVPAPLLKEDGTYNWNIKYTDDLLYKHYNLDSKYIKVIEAVIKERK